MTFPSAIGIHQRAGISFWDSMIVRSAAEMGCDMLYSEDLNAGQNYSGVRAENLDYSFLAFVRTPLER